MTLVTLSQRGKAALQFLRDDLSISPGRHYISARPDDATVRTWTFAGTRVNRTLARRASIGRAKVKFDAISVQAPLSLLTPARTEPLVLTDDEIFSFAESIKFSACLPRNLLEQTIIARSFDPPEPGA